MFGFGSKEGINHFLPKTNPHLVGSRVGNGNSHLKRLNWSQNRSWWPSCAAQLGASDLSGHPTKPKGWAASRREMFWGILGHFGAGR